MRLEDGQRLPIWPAPAPPSVDVLDRPRKGVIAVDIEIVETEADQIDPELVRHIP